MATLLLSQLMKTSGQTLRTENKNYNERIRSDSYATTLQKSESSWAALNHDDNQNYKIDIDVVHENTTRDKQSSWYSRMLRYNNAPDIETRIVGGKPVVAGSYPSYAVPVGNGLCGATLIHDDILVSAAHCQGIFADGVILGTVSLSGNLASDVRGVAGEYPNPNFNYYTLAGDVMLIKLAEPVNDPSIITPYNTDSSNPTDGDTVTVIGFGAQEEGGPPSNDLMEVQVQIASYDECYQAYFQPFYGSNIQSDLMICANGVDENGGTLDSCQGE
jgi:secreted trypsin-like serine protease